MLSNPTKPRTKGSEGMSRQQTDANARKRIATMNRAKRAETLVVTDNPDDAEQIESERTGDPDTLVNLDSPDDGYANDPATLGIQARSRRRSGRKQEG